MRNSGDIYVDDNGKRWRVGSTHGPVGQEPTVELESMEPNSDGSAPDATMTLKPDDERWARLVKQ